MSKRSVGETGDPSMSMTHPGRDSLQESPPTWGASSHIPAQLILPHPHSSNDETDKSGLNIAS